MAKISSPCTCRKLILSTNNDETQLWQKSKLGIYEKHNHSINDRIVYHNVNKNQYLFWESGRDGYWLVSVIEFQIFIN